MPSPAAQLIDRLTDRLGRREAQIAARAKPVYMTINPVGQVPPPWTKPATWLHISFYNSAPVTPTIEGAYHIPHENLKAIGRLCRDGGVHDHWDGQKFLITAGAPVMLDWEGMYLPPPESGLSPADAFTIFRDYIRAFKTEAPAVKVGVYGLWTNFTGADASDTRILLDECDILCPSCYFTDHSTVDHDVEYHRSVIREMRYRDPMRPVYPVVTNAYVFEKLEIGREGDGLTRMILDEADGMMLWTDTKRAEELFGPVVREWN